MSRNILILAGLLVVQLGVAYILKVTPDLVNWSWQLRLVVAIGIFLAMGGIASLLFVGSLWPRIGWVAIAAALPSLIAEAISWSDAAYPNLGYLVAVSTAVVASVGALITLTIAAKRLPR
jgi:hypothetical protein